MATTYNRRINLYINGKEVKNDIASIKGEMAKLTNQQARMTISTQEYNAHAAKIKHLRGIIDQHNQSLRNTEQSWFSMKRAAEGFNRYFGMITAALASFAGVAVTIKGAVNAYAEFDDKIADVMKTTGLTKEEVKALNLELKKIDTRTAQEELLGLARVAGKLGITDPEEVLGFVRAADQIVVALSEDLGGAEDAVRELGKLTDIFKLKDLYGQEEALLKVGSAINELGMASTANEGYLVEFSKRTAGIAPQAGVSIENILGLAATLDALGQKAEMSSTAYSKLMTTMTKKTAEFARIAQMEEGAFSKLLSEDANEAMIRVFEGLNRNTNGFDQLVAALGDLGIEGQRMTSVFGALANNTEMLREQQRLSNEAFAEGTSLTNEFNIKNNTAQATLEKARKRFAEIQRELGERLAPAYASVIKKGSTLIKVLGLTVEFLFKHGRQIMAVVGTIAAYTIATKVAVMWQNRYNTTTLAGIAIQKLQTLAFNAQFAAISLYNAAVALLTGRVNVAAIQFKAFSAAMMMNPVGIVAGAIVAAAAALYLYTKRLTAAEKAQKMVNDVNLQAKQNIVEEKLEVERLLKVARDENRLKEERLAAINKLKEIAPKYLGDISLETINTEKATKAVQNHVAALEQEARVIAAREKLIEIEKELLKLQSGEGAALTFWQQAWNAVKTGGNTAGKAAADATTATNNLVNRQKELNLQKEKMLEITNRQNDADSKKKKTDPVDPDDSTQIVAPLTDDEIKKRIQALEVLYNQELALIKKRHLEGKTTQDQYNDDLLKAELKFLNDKLQVYKAGSKEYEETLVQSLEKQLVAEKRIKDLLLKAEQELTDAKISNIQDEIARQEEAEKNKWAKEQAELSKRLIVKENLTAEEIALNDTLYALIEEGEKAHQERMRKLKDGQQLTDLKNLVTASEPIDDAFATKDDLQANFDARSALIEAQYAKERELAGNNQTALLAAERNYNKDLYRLKSDQIDAEYSLTEKRIDTAFNYIGMLGAVVEEESALGKALFAFNQGLAIAEVWVNIAKANAKAIAASPLTFGQPWVGANTLQGAAQTAMIVGQTVAKFSKAGKKTREHAEGKYDVTGESGKKHKAKFAGKLKTGMYGNDPYLAIFNEVPGEPELVIDGKTTKKIQANFPQIIDSIYAVKDGRIPEFAEGKLPAQVKPKSTENRAQGTGQVEMAAAIDRFIRAVDKLMSWEPSVAVEVFERKMKQYREIKEKSGL